MIRTNLFPPRGLSLRAITQDDSVEWVDIPLPVKVNAKDSLQADDEGTIRPYAECSAVGAFNTAWGNTMPCELDGDSQSIPFCETIMGLITREVHEPDVFRHFFGDDAQK